jgi:hypothetical protein
MTTPPGAPPGQPPGPPPRRPTRATPPLGSYPDTDRSDDELRREQRASELRQRRRETDDPFQRLTQLKKIHDAGLITDEEYAAKRVSIIDEI